MGDLIYIQNDANSNINTEPNPQQSPQESEAPADTGDHDTPAGEESDYSDGNQSNILVPGQQDEWPVFDNPSSEEENENTWSSIITMFPKPIIPCYYCDSDQVGLVRFLNAAADYPAFYVFINDQIAVNGLDNGDMTQYGRVSAEELTITVTGENDYEYVKKQIQIPAKSAITIAIINTDSGLDLMVIEDILCNGGINTGCFRVCNLSITNRRINVMLNDGSVIFRNVNYKQVTNFQYTTTGYYMVSVSGSNFLSGNILLSSNIYIRGNVSYTLYVFNWSLTQNAIRILIVEDRRN
ncbi:DUF4397 domain-containing protein [Lacrimispora sp. JR3]|uniref:DUF4397 domain-containing protein n=1 Tax=Lacrimispora sinapis TaxID=3111456 RepID=UPI003748F2CD